MSASNLFQQPVMQAIGLALLHFVWQGTLVGALAALTLAALRRSAADVRYVVATIALTLMMTMPVVTALQVLAPRAPGSPSTATSVASFGAPAAIDGRPIPAASPAAPSAQAVASEMPVGGWLPVFVGVWLCGVLLLTLRLASGWLWVQRMKTHGTAPATAALETAAARLARRLHIARGVRLLESTLVDVPTVIGWIKPVILLPASALAGLTPVQLEAILAHELAHIRRHDYLVNLLQTLVETLLFYHPAVWWLSRRIRVERENCCDDLAVSLCGDPYTYAKALADLEDLRGPGGQLVMAASGGSLIHRVRRLLGAPTDAGRGPGWLAASVAVVLMLGLVATAVGRDVMNAQAATAAQKATADEAKTRADVQSPRPAVAETAEARARAEAMRADAKRQDVRGQMAVIAGTGEEMARAAEQAGAVLADSAARLGEAATAIEATSAVLASAGQSTSVSTGKTSGNFIWSSNGAKLEMNYAGDVEFTDDDADVKRLSPGGTIRLADGGWFASHTVEFKADASGNITRRYWSGRSEKPFEPEGREWLAQTLPKFIRQTGLGARARVARILKAKGTAGVLAGIALIEGSYAKRIYFTELLRTPIDAKSAGQVLAQAGRGIDSDYELATMLIDAADKLLVTDEARQAYFEAAKSIDSDYEMRRVYTAALERGPVSSALLAAILDSSRAIESDYEHASLLVQIAGLQPLDEETTERFFRAVAEVSSDYERGRVLKEVLRQRNLSNETLLSVIRAASAMGSDYEVSQVLQAVAAARTITGPARDAYIDAAGKLGDYEQGRALAALVKGERK